MRDQEIIQRDEAVSAQGANRLIRMAGNFDKTIAALQTQLQRASQVAIQNHLKLEAMASLLVDQPPLFRMFGRGWFTRRLTAADLDARFCKLEADMAAMTAARAKAEAEAVAAQTAADAARQARDEAPMTTPDAVVDQGRNAILGPDGKPVAHASVSGAGAVSGRKGVVAPPEGAGPAAGVGGGEPGA